MNISSSSMFDLLAFDFACDVRCEKNKGHQMIISHKHKFIFIKTSKTAGTSIEIALSKFCAPNDIITPITLEDEETRKNLAYRGPQNYELPIWQYDFRDAIRWATKGEKKRGFYNHISAQQVIALIGKKKWNSYYTFCFERNPWDRIISQYYWLNKSEPRPTIQEFIRSTAPMGLKNRGYENYTIDGKVVVDKVCKYENLNKELDAIRKLVGIPEQLELPRAKSKYRKDKRSYRDVLGVVDRAYISKLFHEEISMMGYEW